MATASTATNLANLKGDFRNFLFYVWHFLGLPDPTDVQYDVAHYLQFGPDRQIIEAYRGFGKSWVTSTFVIWSLWNDPDMKILVVSASKQRSDDFTNFTKRLIADIPFLKHLKAKADQRDSSVAFDVGPAKPAHAPSVKSVGIFGQLTGSRANLIVLDDTEVPNNANTVEMREKLLKAVLESESIVVPGGRVTFLGTPQTEESIYSKLRKDHNYKSRIWPSRYPVDVNKYQNDLAPFILEALEKNPKLVGQPTDPLHFSDITLMEKEAIIGRSTYQLQFQLDTTLSDRDRYPLKTADLVIMACKGDKGPISLAWASDPDHIVKDLPGMGFSGDTWHRPMFISKEFEDWNGSVMSIDPSGRGKDETGYAVIKHLNGTLFCPCAGGLKGGYDEPTLVTLAKIARDEKVKAVIIEGNFGDGMFAKLFAAILRKHWPCAIEEVKHSIQKERRIADTLEPILGRHKLVMDPSVVKLDYVQNQEEPKYSLIHQLTRLTRDRGALGHDDRLDALSIAVAYWVESMSRNIEAAAEDYKALALNEELKKFIAHAVGSQGKAKNTHNYRGKRGR